MLRSRDKLSTAIIGATLQSLGAQAAGVLLLYWWAPSCYELPLGPDHRARRGCSCRLASPAAELVGTGRDPALRRGIPFRPADGAAGAQWLRSLASATE